MKKFILCLMVAATASFVSCSSDDDGGSQDPIVGTWKLIGQTPSTFNPTGEVSDCVKRTTFTFNANNSYSAMSFGEDIDATCILESVNGTWENVGNSTYGFSVGGEQAENVMLVFEGNMVTIDGEIYQKQ